jgi:CRISPR system Cascade subunit CasB
MIRERSAAAAWWHEMGPKAAGGGDRAVFARLRRCATVGEVMLEPATIALFRRCKADDARDLPRIALAAGVLAHVRAPDPSRPVARRIGPEAPEKPETALLKPLRFRALMEARSEDERLIAFRRLVGLADRTLNVADLADALLAWTDERKRRWVFDYWNAGAPSETTSPITASARDTAA